MRVIVDDLWQLNIEFSLLLLLVMAARYAIRKTTRNYNAFLLWLSIPLGLLASISVSFIDFAAPPAQFASVVVQSYLVEPVRSIDYSIYFICSWFLIALGLLIRLGFQHFQLRLELNSFAVRGDHPIKSRYPVVLIGKENFSPAVYGFFQPKIYFPSGLINELSEPQIRLIIKHEEHHIRQKHLWLNLMWDVLVCCVWFNPVVYIARRCFRHDQELYCDYLALKNANPAEQEDYGLALLSTLSLTQPVSLLCSWKAFNQIEERIMNMKNIKSINVILFAGAVAIIGMTSLYAADKVESEIEWPNPYLRIGGSAHDIPSASAKALLEGMQSSDISCGYSVDYVNPIPWNQSDQEKSTTSAQPQKDLSTLALADDCVITQNNTRRDLTSSERAAYLAYLKQKMTEERSSNTKISRLEINAAGEFDEEEYRKLTLANYPQMSPEHIDARVAGLKAGIKRDLSSLDRNKVFYLLGANDKVYRVGSDGIKRPASDAESVNFFKYLPDQASPAISASERSPSLVQGDEMVNTKCVFYGDALEQYDECIEIKAGVERTMTRKETIAQRVLQSSK